MQYILFDLFISAMAIAGFSAIWRNWLEDHKGLDTTIRTWLRTGDAHKVFTCGPCFTYWVALVYTLLFTPLGPWAPAAWNNAWLALGVNTLIQWMALAWLAVFFRFAYTALQQTVRHLD